MYSFCKLFEEFVLWFLMNQDHCAAFIEWFFRRRPAISGRNQWLLCLSVTCNRFTSFLRHLLCHDFVDAGFSLANVACYNHLLSWTHTVWKMVQLVLFPDFLDTHSCVGRTNWFLCHVCYRWCGYWSVFADYPFSLHYIHHNSCIPGSKGRFCYGRLHDSWHSKPLFLLWMIYKPVNTAHKFYI